jgi:hypothetical protein
MKQRDENTFFCFSPPVMVATFTIEISLALWAWWRYKMTPVSRLISLILLCLATFQMAEYQVCQGAMVGSALSWSRLGYVAIAMLPPLGLHLLCTIAGKARAQRWLIGGAYAAGAAFASFFLFSPSAIGGHACLGNYVIFQVAQHSGALFGAYYYGLLLTALLMGWHFTKAKLADAKTRRAIRALLFGYLVFIVPTVAVNIVNPSTIDGIPSIMCGFAVLLAIALAFWVLPATVPKKQ